MITLRNIHKSFGMQTLLEDASLQINSGDRYALVGPNGAGKSTLFKMLLGEEEPDAGEVQLRRGAVVGYLPQENPPVTDKTVLEETLSQHDDPDGRKTAKAKEILMGLGFKVPEFDKPVSALSGGWAMRVAMARLLILEPDLLLLDEPTNHLDLDSLFWFQEYLTYYPGAIFMISHDRAFINNVCRAIVSVADKTLKLYHGDYEFYLSELEREKAKIESAYHQQQVEISQMEEFISRNRARVSTASRAQSMIKRLEKLERISLPTAAKFIKIRFPQPPRTGVRVLSLKNLYKSYGPVKVYEGLDFDLERGWKMAFVGHNGAGKSTLLKVLAGVIPFDSGERVLGMNVKVGYFSQHRADNLNHNRTVLQEALDNDRMNPEQMVRTVLGTFLFPGDSVFKKVSVLSGGEKSRVALVKLLLDPPNVLLMDEPTTHLDMASVDALVAALKEFEGTLCVISHDLYFLNSLADHVVHIEQGKIVVYPGNYDYFKRRQQQLEDAAGPAAPKQKSAATPGEPAATPKNDERRKARETEKLKTEIHKLTEQLEALASRLQDPKIYEDFNLLQSIGDEMHQVQESLQEKTEGLERLVAG